MKYLCRTSHPCNMGSRRQCHTKDMGAQQSYVNGNRASNSLWHPDNLGLNTDLHVQMQQVNVEPPTHISSLNLVFSLTLQFATE